VRDFLRRPFSPEWAKVVNGVGLASLTMRAERVFGDFAGYLNPDYARSIGLAQAVSADLRDIVRQIDRATPALPSEARVYFGDLRSLVLSAIVLHDRWWATGPDGNGEDDK
jgi:hypothetical protein